ncbi:MAG: hypothetical protein H7Y19_08980, partial [Luteimonas sp.]|nr:hypothetical protein [Luteimonas sp.]
MSNAIHPTDALDKMRAHGGIRLRLAPTLTLPRFAGEGIGSTLLRFLDMPVERHNFGAKQRQLTFAGQVAFEAIELLAEIGD